MNNPNDLRAVPQRHKVHYPTLADDAMGRSRTGDASGEGGEGVSAGREAQAHAHQGDRATQGVRGGGRKNRAGAIEAMHLPQPRYTYGKFFVAMVESDHVNALHWIALARALAFCLDEEMSP